MRRGIKTIAVKLLDYLFLVRPLLLVPVWGFSALGYAQAKVLEGESVFSGMTYRAITDFAPMVFFSLSVASVYVFNQIADFEVDEKNEGFPLLVKSGISRGGAWAVAFVFAVLSMALCLLFSIHLAWLCFAALAVGYFYCFRPWYFTGRPFLDFISNAIGYGIIAFAAGWHIAGGALYTISFIYSALPYVLLMCAGSISSTIPDMPGDKLEGKTTTAVFLGKKHAHFLAAVIVCAAGIVSYMHKDWFALAGAAAAFPFYVAYMIRPTKSMQEITYKVGGAALMIVAAVAYPVFLLPSGAILLCTWFYFRFRHGVLYPSLNPAGHVSK